LRHAFGINAVRVGIPLNLIQRWMGHASMKTTAIYLDAIGDEEREIARRMW
jgi:site-specific recombinase XerD